MPINIVLNFKEIVRQYVSPHRRQPNRLNWLWALVDLGPAWDNFSEWRSYYRYKVHVTSQHQSLQGHLVKTFGSGILIRSYDDGFLDVGLDTEPAHWVFLTPFQPVALDGEGEKMFDDVDFIVHIPQAANIDLVAAEVEKYKLADKKYKIIQK